MEKNLFFSPEWSLFLPRASVPLRGAGFPIWHALRPQQAAKDVLSLFPFPLPRFRRPRGLVANLTVMNTAGSQKHYRGQQGWSRSPWILWSSSQACISRSWPSMPIQHSHTHSLHLFRKSSILQDLRTWEGIVFRYRESQEHKNSTEGGPWVFLTGERKLPLSFANTSPKGRG